MPLDRLPRPGEGVLIGSGALGTYLRDGAATHSPVELMNLEDPERVLAAHRAYLGAGSNVLLTNTFAANRVTLEEYGLADRVAELNARGVELARSVAAGAPVWASVGPLSLGFRADDYSEAQLTAVYEEQLDALRAADVLVLETFTSPREAEAALRAAGGSGLPFIFQLGRVGAGATGRARVERLVADAVAAGAVGVGANCQHPVEIVRMVGDLAAMTDLPITASANAGNPVVTRGAVGYEFEPEDLARLGEMLVAAGAAVVGGCCGTTPAHIRALAERVGGSQVRPRRARVRDRVPQADVSAPARPSRPNRVRRLIASDRRLVSVEIRADRLRAVSEIVEGARGVVAAGADLLDVPDNPAASVGRSAFVVAASLQSALGVPAIAHMAATQSNALRLHADVLGCWDLGLDGLLALTGDPPGVGHLAGVARRVTDLRSSVELLRLVGTLRRGELLSGDAVADAPDLCAGAAVRAGEAQARWLDRKIEAGAEFAFSQPCFDRDQLLRLRDDVGDRPVRLFPGVLPLTTLGAAESLSDGRIPGIEVPPEHLRRLADLESPADRRAWGLDRAAELVAWALEETGSAYLIMPFGRSCYTDAARVLEAARGAG